MSGLWRVPEGVRRAGMLVALASGVGLVSCKELRVTAVDVSAVVVSAPVTHLAVGQSARFTVRIVDAAGRELVRDVTWSSSAPSVASVSADGMVTGLGNGDATITASVEGRTDQATIAVGDEPVATVEVVPAIASMLVGDTLRLRVILRSESGDELFGRAVTWATTDANVADVGVNGLVRAHAVGSVTVTATVEGVRGQAEISVNASLMTVASVRVDPASASIGVGDSVKLAATALASNGAVLVGRPVTWTTGNSAVATVTSSGTVQARAQGSAVITATIDGVSGSATVTVTPPTIESLTVSPSTTTLAVGGSLQFEATIRASDGTVVTGIPITWTSADPVVASVNATGLVTANAVGTVVITASGGGVSGSATVFVVVQPVAALTITPRTPSVLVGDSILLDANPVDGNGMPLTGRPVSWSTADAAIAAAVVNGPNLQQAWLRGVSAGATYVYAESGARRDSTLATVLARADLAVTKTAPVTQVKAGDTIAFTLVVRNDGPSPASGVVVTDTLPVNATFVDATGGASLSGGVLTWPTIAGLAVGASQSFTVRVEAPATGVVTNVAAATMSTAEADPADNRAAASVAVAPPDLSVRKTASAAIVNAGETIVFTIDVTNAGPSMANSVVVTDTLPANATFIDATGSPVISGNILTWQIPTLAVGAASQYTVRVTAPASGAVRNVATAFAANGEATPADNVSEVTVGVTALADLAVTKRASSQAVDAGATIDYAITVRNIGLSAAANVEVTDTLPGNAAFVSASGSPTVSGGILTWTVASIAAGDSSRFTVQVTAPKQGTVTNVAAAVTTTGEASIANNVSSVSTLVNPADLRVAKSGPAVAAPGSAVVYTIQIQNDGPGSASDVLVTDVLPSGAVFMAASGGGTESGGVVTWPVLASLASGAPAITYTVEITAAQSGPMINVASVQAATADPDPTDNSSSVSTEVALADLSVTKSGPASVNAGEIITYTLDVLNAGPTSAAGAVLVDSLPAGASFVGASVPPTSQSGNALTWGPSSIGSGGSLTIDVQVRAPAGGPPLNNVARVSAATADPDATNNRAEVTTTVVPVANLAITKTGPAQADPGATVAYSIGVTNAGPSTASGVVVTDVLPAGATFVSATGGGTESGGTVTWPAASLPVGQDLAYSVTVTLPAAAGTYTNTAQVTASTLDLDLSDNAASAQTEVTQADLSVSKTGPAAATAADVITYTITVSNAGPSQAAAVVVTDTLPASATFVDASPAGSLSGNVVTWNLQSLAASAQATFTVRVRGPAAGGTITNAAAAVSSTSDPQPADNHDSVSTAVSPAADLSVTKTASATQVSANDTITYTIDVTNLGPSDAAGVEVTDTLPVGFLDATGSPTLAGNVLTWTVGSLARGASVSYTVRVIAGPSGTVTNVAAVTSTTADPSLSNNVSSVAATIAPANIDVSIIAPSSVSPGSQMTYTVQAINGGPGRAIGVSLESPPATNATYDGHSAGTRDPVTGVITLSGDLGVGDTLRFEVTVTPDGTGDIQMSATASSTSLDPDATNNTANATTTLSTSAADLVVTVSSSPAAVLVGEMVTYTITVQNNGPGDAVGVNLNAALPPSNLATFISADGSFQKVGDSLTWVPFAIADGGSVSYDVVVTAAAAGNLTLTASANALNNDPKPNDNTDSATSIAN